MNCNEAQVRLDDYLDGLLAESDRRALAAHARTCSRCREEVSRLRALLDDAAELPKSLEPARDLWPEIADRIRQRRVVSAELHRRGPRAVWYRRVVWAAAAVLLIALSSTVTAILMNQRSASGIADARRPVAEPAPPGTALTHLPTWEAEYLRAMAELVTTLEDLRGSLPPKTVALIEANLRIIDQAIQESRVALAHHPNNEALGQMLAATYRRKLELLRQATRLATET